MLKKNSIKRSLRQISAIVEKEIRIESRVKSSFLYRYISPLIQLFVTLFVFGLIFSIQDGYKIGYWDQNNYILFLLIANIIATLFSVIQKFQRFFNGEKYWKTLSAIMIAPVHRFSLLAGIMISELVMASIPLITLFIIAYILFPIPLIYLLVVLITYLLIYLTFSSIGLIIGVFLISHESYVSFSLLAVQIIFLLSCSLYPIQVFPEFLHFFIRINPLYYMFDLLKLEWYLGLDFELTISYITPLHIIFTILTTIVLVLGSIFLFERIYKKYGITGY